MEIKTLYFNENCNIYLLINNQDCLIVDPGFNRNNCLINEIKSLKLNLKGVLITHAHFDHIEGLLNIKNVPIYIYKGEEKSLADSKLNCSFMTMFPFTVDAKDIRTISDNQILELCGIKIRVIHTPFHTAGSVCYYIKENKTLLSGDALFNKGIGRYDLVNNRADLTKDSLNKLFKLPHLKDDDTTVLPGHGEKTTLSKEYTFLKEDYSLLD